MTSIGNSSARVHTAGEFYTLHVVVMGDEALGRDEVVETPLIQDRMGAVRTAARLAAELAGGFNANLGPSRACRRTLKTLRFWGVTPIECAVVVAIMGSDPLDPDYVASDSRYKVAARFPVVEVVALGQGVAEAVAH
jgi:tetrahydromethanopterin S-methyltransferase subunit C